MQGQPDLKASVVEQPFSILEKSQRVEDDLCRYPEGGTDTNVTVLVTNVGADYTALGSFGSADSFGENLIASLDRSFLLRGGMNRPRSVQARPITT